MSQQELLIAGAGDSPKAGSGKSVGSSSRACDGANFEILEEQIRRHIPVFEAVDVEDARARAAVEQWRTFTMLLEPQPGSPEAASVCEQMMKLATAGEQDSSGKRKTRFTVVTKELLVETAKQNGISGKRALAQALVWIMRKDQEEGLAAKKIGVAQGKDKDDFRDDEESNILIEYEEPGDNEKEDGGVQGDGEAMPPGEDEEQSFEAFALKQAAREKARLELRAARLFTTVDDDLGAPDRVYILKGFPVTDADAAQFLEENDAYYTTSASVHEKNSAAQQPRRSDERPPFLSALDAVVQLTTRDLTSRPMTGSQQSERGSRSRPGTASSGRRPETPSSAGSTQSSPNREGGGREIDEKQTPRKRESSREKNRIPPNPFTQASGVTKTLAVAQTKGGTVWQDLSFCYINVTAREHLLSSEKRPSSPKRKSVGKSDSKAPGKDTEKPKVETRDIVDLAAEFNRMVNQMAFEKFDFHQWFSTAQVVAIPRRDGGIDLAQAITEAQAAVTGTSAGGLAAGCGSTATKVEGSLWATDPTLASYADLVSAVPEEFCTVATTLYSMVEAVMQECTGAPPRTLSTSLPAPLSASGAAHTSSAPPVPPASSIASASERKAPISPSNRSLGQSTLKSDASVCSFADYPTPTLGSHRLTSESRCLKPDSGGLISETGSLKSVPGALKSESGDTRIEQLTEGTDSGALAAREDTMQPPLPRNLVLEFGDLVGKRAACGTLNRAAAFGESRVDPRALVAVERAAIEKLQNPRLVGQGALPREPEQSEKDRGTERSELKTFTDLGKKDVDRTRQVWALERLLNSRHPPPGQGEVWSFLDRRYWDVLPPHVVQQVLQSDNGTEPLCVRQYYPPTDELLIALFHVCPPGRARIRSWDPCTSGSIPFSYRPSFKEWENMAVAKGSSYTPRTLAALGAIMDVSKADLDRAKTKSVKVFPADHSLVVMKGFVATGERWLSTFKDGHVMGLKLTELKKNQSRAGTPEAASRRGTSDPHGGGGDAKGVRIEQFAARFTMAFDDDSRIVIQEGVPPPPPPPPMSASPGGKKGKMATSTPTNVQHAKSTGKKPDGFGTISCVQTFPTGLVVTTSSDGTVCMKFVPNPKGGGGGGDKLPPGSAPEASREELARAVVGRGTVVRYMRDGSVQMLFVTGDVVICTKDETILTDKCGKSFRKAQKPCSDQVKPPTAPDKKATAPATSASNVLESPLREWIPIPRQEITAAAPAHGKAGKAGKTGDQTAKIFGSKSNTSNASSGFERNYSKHAGCSKTNDGRLRSVENLRASKKRSADGGTPTRDVETGALVWCSSSRGNGTKTVVVYEDGLTVTRHADGTVQRWQRNMIDQSGEVQLGIGLVLVECAGFPSVEVDVEIEEVCSKHARGEPVTITKGGNRVRMRAAMPNGGATLVTYDTRVTSQVCGRVVYVHADNTEVIASDKGEVVVRPRGLWEGKPVHDVLAGPNSSMPPNCAQPELLVGAYTFDCLKGSMESEDIDRNRFVLDVTKADFLKEGFTISRVGGSTAGGASSGLPVSKEKGKRSSSRPSSGKSDGVIIDLAGENTGVRADAVVNNPLEPRLFIYRRDGSALELLRTNDAQKWCERLSLELPPPLPHQDQDQDQRHHQHHHHHHHQQQQQQRRRPEEDKGVGRPQMQWTAAVVEDECCADPHSRRARQLSFFVPLQPTLRGEGSFAAFLRRRSGHIFGDGYHTQNGGDAPSSSCWRTRSLPLAAKSLLGEEIGTAACGTTTAMEACIRRVWLEHSSLSREAEEELRLSLARWGAWKQARAEQIDRFAVSDPRPKTQLEAQLSIQKRLRKALREAKAARQKKREKARAARAKAAAEQAERIAMGMSAGAAATSNGTLEELSTVEGGTWEGDGDEEDEVDYPDSDDEEDEETLLLREESASAYASAGGESRGHLDIAALRLAMVTVLGRSIRESEAESRLLAVRKRTFPRQLKASVSDLFDILLADTRASKQTQEETRTIAAPPFVTTPPEGRTGKKQDPPNHLRCPWEGSAEYFAPPYFKTSLTAGAGNMSTKFPPTPAPRDFWSTSVGRSLGGASGVGWTKKSGDAGDMSRGVDKEKQKSGGDLSRGGLVRDAVNRLECEADGEGGGGVGYPTSGNDVEGVDSGSASTGRGGGGQGCGEVASTEIVEEKKVGLTSTVPAQAISRSSKETNDPFVDIPSSKGGVATPAATSISQYPPSERDAATGIAHYTASEGVDAPVETGISHYPTSQEVSAPVTTGISQHLAPTAPAATGVSQYPTSAAPISVGVSQHPMEQGRRGIYPSCEEYDALAENRRENTRPSKTCGGYGDEQLTRNIKNGRYPPAQGTGTKAVRSLSQVAGETALVEGEESSLLYASIGGNGCRSSGRSLVFEVTPTSVSLGRIEVGRRYTVKIQVANVADKPARFRIDSFRDQGGNGEGCVTVASYTRGKVAAGIAVAINLDVLARRPGTLLEVLSIVAEDGTTEVVVRGEAFGDVEGSAIAALP